jgi:pyruvate formate lyase activating enzyme
VKLTDLNAREAMLQAAEGTRVRCLVCERRCRIVDGGLGWCRTRANRGGRLFTLIYGALSSVAINPIEKKPFFHFHPGTLTLTAGSWSCNFGCPWCQNWPISKSAHPAEGEFVSPEEFVYSAESQGCQGTSISFNEPTLSLEWSLEVFRLARSRGLYNTFVTNGYMTEEALNLLAEAGLDAMNVDIKGDAASVRHYCKGVDVEKVWEICRTARRLGVHLEITTLVIPTVNDSSATLKGIAGRIVAELGNDVVWHTSAYFPAYRFAAPPTPVRTLERARTIGKHAGLDYVYTGNVAGHEGEDTVCPECGLTLIRRRGFDVLANRVTDGKCPRCGFGLSGVWD